MLLHWILDVSIIHNETFCLILNCRRLTSDEVLLKEIMKPGSELLQVMADKLNRELPAVENWRNLAFKLEIPAEVSREFSDESTWQKGTSPTKEVMKWVAAQFPDTTLKDLVKALDKIQRNDAIQIISKQFPDTVGKCKNCSSCLNIIYLN